MISTAGALWAFLGAKRPYYNGPKNVADFLLRLKISRLGWQGPGFCRLLPRISPVARSANQHIESYSRWKYHFLDCCPLRSGKSQESSFNMPICSKGNRCRARHQHPDLILTENNFRNPARLGRVTPPCNRNRCIKWLDLR